MGQRLVRVIRVLKTLQAAGPATADTLAQELCVSRRTVFRDLEALRGAGFRIDYDHSRGIYEMHASHSKATQPSAKGVAELLLQAAATTLPQTHWQRRVAKRAASLLMQGLPVPLQEKCLAMQEAVHSAEPIRDARGSRSKLDTVLDAICNNRCIQVLSLTRQVESHGDWWVTKPLQIIRAGDRWLLEALILPTGRGLRVNLSKVGIEPTDRKPPPDDWSAGQVWESAIEID